jgi:hypothetical protein
MNFEIERRKQEIFRVCKHEAGHCIMSKELGFKTNGIAVKITTNGHKASAGITILNQGIDNIEKTKEFLEKRIKVLYAGGIAESINGSGELDKEHFAQVWEEGGGHIDHANIRELVRLLRDLVYPNTTTDEEANKELKALDDRLINEAGEIVGERIQIIEGIAQQITERINELNIQYDFTEDDLNKIKSIRDLYGS